MKIFITGAAGYIGSSLAFSLADKGHEVHAFVRCNPASKSLNHPNIKIFYGDVLRKQSIVNGMRGCKQVYHTAARVGAWAQDSRVFYDVNVKGTENVLDAALDLGIEKIVFTSTCGVLGSSTDIPRAECEPNGNPLTIDYDISKKMSEDLVLKYSDQGMHVVIVSPSKVYGPGSVSHSLTANAIIERFIKRGITFIPSPGTYKVCFAFIDDVVSGHLLAMENGRSGEKYILGGTNISYLEFFRSIREITGSRGQIVMLQKKIVKSLALIEKIKHKLTGYPMRFTGDSVDYIFNSYPFSSSKAIRELGYQTTPLEEGLHKTIQFLNNKPND